MWSIGVSLFILITGKTPFNGATLNELFKQILLNKIKLNIDDLKIRLLSEDMYDFLCIALDKDQETR